MIIGVLQVEILIDGSQSLKDKRRVVSILKDWLHRRYCVSVAEVGLGESHRMAILGITLASNSEPICRSVLDKILNLICVQRDCVLNDHTTEILTGY